MHGCFGHRISPGDDHMEGVWPRSVFKPASSFLQLTFCCCAADESEAHSTIPPRPKTCLVDNEERCEGPEKAKTEYDRHASWSRRLSDLRAGFIFPRTPYTTDLSTNSIEHQHQHQNNAAIPRDTLFPPSSPLVYLLRRGTHSPALDSAGPADCFFLDSRGGRGRGLIRGGIRGLSTGSRRKKGQER